MKGLGEWRKVARDKYDDKWYRGLSKDARSLLEYMRCACLDCGVIEYDEERWSAATKLSIDEVRVSIGELMKGGKFEKAEEDGEVFYLEKGFIEYQQDSWQEVGGKVEYNTFGGRFYRIHKELSRFGGLFSHLRERYFCKNEKKSHRSHTVEQVHGVHIGGTRTPVEQVHGVPNMNSDVNVVSSEGGGECERGEGDTSLTGANADILKVVASARGKYPAEVWDTFLGNTLLRLDEGYGKQGLSFEVWVQLQRNYPSVDWEEIANKALMRKAQGVKISNLQQYLSGVAKNAPDKPVVPQTKKVIPKSLSPKEKFIQIGLSQGETLENLETAWETDVKHQHE